MKKQILIFLLLIIISNSYAQTKITAIEAKLFYNQQKQRIDNVPEKDTISGTFSENVIDNPNFELWNTIIGEGSAAGYSSQSIVIISLASNGKIKQKQMLRLTATAKNKIILKQEREICFIADLSTEKAVSKMIFLLNDTGCEEISLKAEIVESGKMISKMIKKIGFACGE
ncbi:MAG: hypothetical protein EOO44_20200 [Flavobacterium sp.]|nr:MAG: hypothetical protein EOO44_20200 [Flavobacterium sp.]